MTTIDMSELDVDIDEAVFSGADGDEDEEDVKQKKTKTRRVRDLLGGGVVHLHINNQLPPTAAETASMIVDSVHSENEAQLQHHRGYKLGLWDALIGLIMGALSILFITLCIIALVQVSGRGSGNDGGGAWYLSSSSSSSSSSSTGSIVQS
jgi:hypothetical protein